ncbi:MAG: hypothetical protein QXS91_02070 [Candidatus Anstonellales archaeon]
MIAGTFNAFNSKTCNNKTCMAKANGSKKRHSKGNAQKIAEKKTKNKELEKFNVIIDTCYILEQLKAGRSIKDVLFSLAEGKEVNNVIIPKQVLDELCNILSSRADVKNEIIKAGLTLSKLKADIEEFRYCTLHERVKIIDVIIDNEEITYYNKLLASQSIKGNRRIGLGEAAIFNIITKHCSLDCSLDFFNDFGGENIKILVLSLDSDVSTLLKLLKNINGV